MKTLSSIGAMLLLVGTMAQAQAAMTLYKPDTATASTISYGAVMGGLFEDIALTQADIGTTAGSAAQYACSGDDSDLDPMVAMDFGSSTTFTTLVYSQRPNGTDNVDSIDLWFGSTPFTASFPATIPGFGPDESLAILPLPKVLGTLGVLRQYDFVAEHTGQYVLARLNSSFTAPFQGNPGGSEMRLGYVPEPSTMVLLAGALLAGACRKRVRRTTA